MSIVAFVTQREHVFFYEAYKIIHSYFPNTVLITNQGKKEEKLLTQKKLESIEYDYVFSFWNYYIFDQKELLKAKLGSINIHPSPVDHPGLGGRTYCYVFPEKRQHHGVTLHLMDEEVDHGRIIRSTKWTVKNLPPFEMMKRSFEESLEMIDWSCKQLLLVDINNDEEEKKEKKKCSELFYPSSCKENIVWGDRLFFDKDEKEWMSELPEDHIANLATSDILYPQMDKLFERNNEPWAKLLSETGNEVPKFLEEYL